MKRLPLPQEYLNMASKRSEYREAGDCGVITLALVTGITYAESHAILKKHGRKDRGATQGYQWQEALDELGFTYEFHHAYEFSDRYPGDYKHVRRVTPRQVQMFPEIYKDGKTYIGHSDNHLFAMIDGEILDWSSGRKMAIYSFWEIKKVK